MTFSRTHLTTHVSVAARYEKNSGAALTKAELFPALDTAIRSHVALGAILPAPPAPPVWICLPTVDLNKVVSFIDKDSDELASVLEDFVSRPMEHPDDMPLWRLLVLRDGMVVFAYDHAMGDGQSGRAFHLALHAALNTPNDATEPHSGAVDLTTLPESTALLPSLEKAMDLSVPFPMGMRELAKELVPPLKGKWRRAWTGNPIPKAPVFDVKIKILQYTPEEAARLLAISREHKTTLTGTLHTLALAILSQLLRDRESTRTVKAVTSVVPISLRPYTGAPATAFCNHVSWAVRYCPLLPPSQTSAPVSRETFPWEDAAALAARLKHEAPHSGRHIGMIKYLFGQYDRYHRSQLGGKHVTLLELSNLGAFPKLPEAGGAAEGRSNSPWAIREMVFAQADATVSSPLKVFVAGNPAGGLAMAVMWTKGAVEAELGQAFVAAFEEGMKALIC